MAAEAHAADAADGKVDIIGHILDHDYLEVPFWKAQHYLDGKITLPSFELFGAADHVLVG